jgi:PAS domain S-box-containing protein
MNDVEFLQQSFDNFTKATASLQQAYANLEQKFENINRELENKNRELEATIAAKEDMKNYLQNILESLTNGVIVTDLAGNVETMNRCAGIFTSVTEEDARGRHIGSLFFGDMTPAQWQDIFFSDYFRGEAGHKVKLKKRTLEIFVSPVHARNGQTLGTVFILRDISRIEKLEDRFHGGNGGQHRPRNTESFRKHRTVCLAPDEGLAGGPGSGPGCQDPDLRQKYGQQDIKSPVVYQNQRTAFRVRQYSRYPGRNTVV